MRRFVCPLAVLLLTVAIPSCDLLGNDCPPVTGNAVYGGEGGGGGGAGGAPYDGFGGVPEGDVGVGAYPGSDVGAGAGPGSGDVGVGAGAGPGSDVGAGAGPGARAVPDRPQRSRWRWHWHYRGGEQDGERIGTAALAICAPKLIPLTTMRLRAIAAAQNIGAGQTGITLSRTIGLTFENWVLTTLGQIPRNTMSFLSPRRQKQNGGLPASVIPEYVSPLALFFWGGPAPAVLPQSEFWEVKAVTGTLTPASNRYQILGLIDVASRSPAGVSTLQSHPPPTVLFTITGNTVLNQDVLTTATQSQVAIWVQVVFEDATIPNDPNPDLYIGQLVAMNPNVYGTRVPLPSPPSGAHSKLTSPTTPPMAVPGDPDPPEVD
jgi:hypothetical protein